jgi:hypothetical protein
MQLTGHTTRFSAPKGLARCKQRSQRRADGNWRFFGHGVRVETIRAVVRLQETQHLLELNSGEPTVLDEVGLNQHLDPISGDAE